MERLRRQYSSTGGVWWLIISVNLTGLKDSQIAGKTLLLDVSVRVSSEEISFWSNVLNKEDLPSLVCIRIIQSFEGPHRTQRWSQGQFPLSPKLKHPYFPARFLGPSVCVIYTSGCPGSLGFWTELHHWLSWFFNLQMTYHGISWPLLLHEPIPVINPLIIYISVSYWFCFYGEYTNTGSMSEPCSDGTNEYHDFGNRCKKLHIW